MLKSLTKFSKIYFLLSFIIILQVLFLIHFINIKTNLHCDEIWTFGLANSYGYPVFWENGFWPSSNNDFYNKWHDGKIWFNYITVQPNETFSFNNAYRNQSLDCHPPFYYYIVHFICSLFPNKFNIWFGEIINIFAFIISQFFLFKIAQKLFQDKYAIAVVSFYGFSMAAINQYIFIGSYSILTMFTLILCYLIIKIIYNNNLDTKNSIFLFVTGLLGFLTYHYFALYFFSLSVGLCLYLLSRKNYKLILKYSSVSILAFICYYCYFPFVFSHMSSMARAMTSKGLFTIFPFKECFTSLAFIINYTIGINTETLLSIFQKITPILNCLNPYIKPIIVLIILFFFYFLIMKKENVNKLNLILFEFITVLLLISCYTILNMQLYFGRYSFSLMPLFCILIVGFIEWLLRSIKISEKPKDFVIYTLIIVFILASHNNSAMEYCFTNKPSREEITELYNGASVISVQKAYHEHFIHTKAREYRYAKRIIPTREYEADEILKAINSIKSDEKNYIIVPENEYGLLIVNMLKKEGVKPRYLFTDNHPNYIQMVFEIYAREDKNSNAVEK